MSIDVCAAPGCVNPNHEKPTADFKAEEIYTELLLGCGFSRKKRLKQPADKDQWENLITCDINPAVNPDVVHDLDLTPWPFQNEEFDEIHAYEVLEHLGQQGDYESFFGHFNEIHRILKPGGVLFASCPTWSGMWAWSDPGHKRIISEGTLAFLDRSNYDNTGDTPMTDYRSIYHGDFELIAGREENDSLYFMLRKK